MSQRREPPSFEIVRVPSDPSLPPGDFHPYRHMGEEARETSFLESLVRILNARRAWEVAQAAGGCPTSGNAPAEALPAAAETS